MGCEVPRGFEAYWVGLIAFCCENPQRLVSAPWACHLSERSTRVATLLYSLIESARLNGAEPGAYLGEAARRTIRNSGSITLPRDLK